MNTSDSKSSTSLTAFKPSHSQDENDSLNAENGVSRQDSIQTLEPGYFWTAHREVGGDGKADQNFNVGETLLLLEVIEFESQVHSITMRVHPKHGERSFTVMVKDFVRAFEPCPDADAIRQSEQQALMQRVNDIQNELMRTQLDPQLMIDAIKGDVDEEIAKAEKEQEFIVSKEAEKTVERNNLLAKTHRRAARRSEAKGNPLVLPKATLASEVGAIIAHGINSSGVAELSRIAGQQAIIARAQGSWLKSKTDEISRTIKALSPYLSERAAVGLARSSSALQMAERIKSGIESLDLYTGKGVDVFDVSSGKPAAPDVPLTLIQGKRYMEEELAAWADVNERFDFQNKSTFFTALADNPHLRDQVLPTPRCVVTMAVLRRTREYGNPLERIRYNMQNQLVFLLVRNGDNVHVVYSDKPSHEGASRLFPTQNELQKPFQGWDGSRVSIRDIEFGKAAAQFDDIALCYKRFLILLCGLDHRLKLLGDFYPEHEQLKFMTSEFQASYFNFVADEETSNLLGDNLRPVSEWMQLQNKALQSGSRVFVLSHGSIKNTPELIRRSTLTPSPDQFNAPFTAVREGARHIVRIHATDRYAGGDVNAKCELDDNSNGGERPDAMPWWLCVDAINLSDVQRYRTSRINRAMGVGYLRLLRRVEAYLIGELEIEKPAREYVLETAVQLGEMERGQATVLLTTAIANWRAARRGQAMPGLHEKKQLNEILTLMVPEGRLPGDMERLLDDYIDKEAVKPLLLTRSGKSKLYLYVEPTDEDKAPYPNVLNWGWLKRITLEAGKTKLIEQSTSLVWLGMVLPASETEVSRWAGVEAWMHEAAEPLSLRKYGKLLALLKDSETCWSPILKSCNSEGLPPGLFDGLIDRTNAAHAQSKSRMVEMVSLYIPVALTSRDGRTLYTVYLKCRSESLIYFYGNSDQKTAVEKRFVARYRDKEKARSDLNNMRWILCTSKEELLIAHDAPTMNGAFNSASWATRNIKICLKGKDFFNKSSKSPRWSERSVPLSFNRAFDELMNASVKAPKRAFYKAIQNEVLGVNSWGWDSSDVKQAKRKAILTKRFEGSTIHAQCNALVWSEDKARSMANIYFKAPLVANAANQANTPVEQEQDEGLAENTEQTPSP